MRRARVRIARIPPRDRIAGVSLLVALVAALPAAATERRAFVTSAMGNADLSTWGAASGGEDGLAGADAVCQHLAEAEGLATAGSPAFRAWLSDSANDAYCRVQGLGGLKLDEPPCNGAPLPGAGPWVKVDGAAFAPALDDLVSGVGMATPLDRDEAGALVPAGVYWTSTRTSGRGAGPGHYCGNWSDSSSPAYVEFGSTASTYFGWTSLYNNLCSHPTGRLACLEVGVGVALPVEPWQPAALAFVTSASGNGNLGDWPAETAGESGIAAGDSICRALATAARLPGADSYLAFLSDSGATDARDRFSIDGPWRRPDHHLVASNLAELLGGRFGVQISLTEQGVHADREVWTGTVGDGTAAAATCGDWLVGDAGNGRIGLSQRASSEWTDLLNRSCAAATDKALYCFGDRIVLFWNDFEAGSLAPPWNEVVGLVE